MAEKPIDPKKDHEHVYSTVIGVDEENNEVKWKACRICGEPQSDKD